MTLNVEGKTAIITGAGSGINFCFAELLLSRGCNVILADLALRPEAEQLISRYPLTSSKTSKTPRAVFQKTDVRDWAQLDKMFAVATEHFGGADIVCPGAGIFEPQWSNFWNPPGSPPSKDDVSESRYALVDVDIVHPIRTTQLAISHFVKRGKPGNVVLVSSIAGQIYASPFPMYVASKHAMNGFVRSLYRLDDPPVGSNLPRIRVNAVAPAMIRTPLLTEDPEKLKTLPPAENAEWITPEDVAAVMLELLEKDENTGGTILEVGINVRRVEPFNDPGPPLGAGSVNIELVEQQMWDGLKKQRSKL